MNTNHLTERDQEEYVLGQRTPAMVQHLAHCAPCQAAVARLEQGVQLFRSAALEWSAQSFEKRPLRHVPAAPVAGNALFPAWQWTVAACLLFLALLPAYFSVQRAHQHEAAVHPAAVQVAPISDDALLQQVDEEVSESVPASMEPLTHLVTTDREAASHASAPGRQHSAQVN
jgi:anti-sigma factor RsiW